MAQETLLVTGASGTLGRQVLEQLLSSGAGPIIATTRDPAGLADFAARGVDVRAADFDRPDGLPAAFQGATRLLLISTDALGIPGQRIAQHRAAVAAAEAAGVAHVVYLSAPAPRPTAQSTLIADHYWTEQALAASRLDWTILRDNIYTDMTLMSLPHAIATGRLFSAAGAGGRSYVTRADCAATAAAALAGATTGKTILDVTGPAPVTQAELAALAAELTGKPVTHVPVDVTGLVAGMTGAGVPPPLAAALADFDNDAAQGYQAVVTATVKDLTGREPVSVREYLTANKAALVG